MRYLKKHIILHATKYQIIHILLDRAESRDSFLVNRERETEMKMSMLMKDIIDRNCHFRRVNVAQNVFVSIAFDLYLPWLPPSTPSLFLFLTHTCNNSK